MATPRPNDQELHKRALRRAQVLRREAIGDWGCGIAAALRRIGSAIARISLHVQRLQRRPPPPRQ